MKHRNRRLRKDKPRRFRGSMNRLGRKLKRSIVYLWPDGRDQRFFSPKNTAFVHTGYAAKLDGVSFYVGVDMGSEEGDKLAP